MEVYGDFTNRRNMFARDNIWIIAADHATKAYKWHHKYSYHQMKVLGKLACLGLSNILGIGTAERNWKQVKAVKSGLHVNTTIDKTKKQVLVYVQYQQMRAEAAQWGQRQAEVSGGHYIAVNQQEHLLMLQQPEQIMQVLQRMIEPKL